MWHRQDPAAYGARLVAFDRRGFGETVAEPEPWSPVDDTLAVLDALGPAPVALMGCSQGGRVALDVALARPERVSALVLVAPAVGGEPEPVVDPELEAEWTAVERAGDVDRINAFEVSVWLDGPSARGRVPDPVRALVLDMNRRALTAAPVGEARWPDDAWRRLEELRVPTLVVWGELDVPWIAPRCEALVARIPGARAVRLPGVAHLPNLEAPERFDPPVISFLRG